MMSSNFSDKQKHPVAGTNTNGGGNFIINAHIIRLILCNYTNIPISGYFFIKPLDNIPFSVYNVIVRKTQRAQPKNEKE